MTRVLYPVLKEPTWPHRGIVVHHPLLPDPAAPIVCFAEDLPSGYAFLMEADAQGMDLGTLFRDALRNLAARPTDLAITSGVAVCGGKDLSAERILDTHFLRTLHQQLGPELYVGIPHRVALYAVSATAPARDLETFHQFVAFEHGRGPELGHAAVSRLAFRVIDARIVDARPLDALRARPSSLPAAPLPARVRHPSELVRVDAARQRIEASVVVVGSGAKRFARALLAASGGAPEGPERTGELEHFVLTLGAIRGWTTQLFVYALDGSFEAIVHTAPSLVVAADAVALVQGDGKLEPALFAMARKAREGAALLAFVGSQDAEDELVRDALVRADLSSRDGAALPVLKEITKHLLSRLKAPAN